MNTSRWVAAALLGLASPAALADPWAPPGDATLRHDIELLADAGIIRAPIMTWPMSWPDVARDVIATEPGAGLPDDVAQALTRVRRAAWAAAAPGYSGVRYRVAVAGEPEQLRGFESGPREEGELSASASWLGDRLAANLTATVVSEPDDDQKLRLDGSYVGFTVANFMFSVGAMERWWGPGWDGSLILSNNARPIPAFTVERKYTDTSKWPVLKWFGPWRASLAIGQAEGSDVALPDVRFFAARVNFKPRPWLEFGLSRSAQFCGGDRPCGFDTFFDLLIGRDNSVGGAAPSPDEPGNQLAGYDFRIRSPWRALPVAVYGQFTGEDEAGGLPAKFLGQLGVEAWTSTALGSLRGRVEYADATCSFTRERPQFGCAYTNAIYPQGYAYRGRIIGHTVGPDGRMTTAAALLVRPSSETWSATFRDVTFNRGNPAAPKLRNLELKFARQIFGGELAVGLGYDDYSRPASRDNETRGFFSFTAGL